MQKNRIENLTCIEIDPTGPATKSVIWMHGLGADGHDFVPIVPELRLPTTLGVRFIFPHAPVIPVTINNRYEMRAWFDIYEANIAARIDETGIADSVALINQLIAKEISRGIASEQIILAGFSQGAVIALMTGLTYDKPLAGIIALSGYLPNAASVVKNGNPANRNIPIFIAHGTEDTVVPYALGKASYEALKEGTHPIEFRSYPMPHSVCGPEIQDIGQWMEGVWKK